MQGTHTHTYDYGCTDSIPNTLQGEMFTDAEATSHSSTATLIISEKSSTMND